ncbi:hypothetical protein [Peribacillus sp. YIM B13477]|uniref:hypothetical protein n=1 Tax=Peribacillus sp. YIM B13477 TaxID=3366300 RepID=UPI003672BFFA
MKDKQLENLTAEQLDKMPPALKMRLGYLKILKEKAEQKQEQQESTIEVKEAEKDLNSPQELFRQAYKTEEQNEEE